MWSNLLPVFVELCLGKLCQGITNLEEAEFFNEKPRTIKNTVISII